MTPCHDICHKLLFSRESCYHYYYFDVFKIMLIIKKIILKWMSPCILLQNLLFTSQSANLSLPSNAIIYCIPKLDVRYKQNLTYYVLYQVLADISLSVPRFQKY